MSLHAPELSSASKHMDDLERNLFSEADPSFVTSKTWMLFALLLAPGGTPRRAPPQESPTPAEPPTTLPPPHLYPSTPAPEGVLFPYPLTGLGSPGQWEARGSLWGCWEGLAPLKMGDREERVPCLPPGAIVGP